MTPYGLVYNSVHLTIIICEFKKYGHLCDKIRIRGHKLTYRSASCTTQSIEDKIATSDNHQGPQSKEQTNMTIAKIKIRHASVQYLTQLPLFWVKKFNHMYQFN